MGVRYVSQLLLCGESQSADNSTSTEDREKISADLESI
jgi:hypothetical protein